MDESFQDIDNSGIKLTVALAVSLIIAFLCSALFYVVLARIELSKSPVFDDNLHLEENGPTGEHSDYDQVGFNEKRDVAKFRTKLPILRKLILLGTTGTIVLLIYLLLVLPNNSKHLDWLAWIGLGCVFVIALRSQIAEEVRRERVDRLFYLVTIALFVAMALNFATYANLKRNEGYIYRGPARIVGYDSEQYANNKDDKVTRTDLEVAWGGSWGCPKSPSDNNKCQGFVQGALCESEEKDTNNGNVRKIEQSQTSNANATNAPGNVTNAEVSDSAVTSSTNADSQQQVQATSSLGNNSNIVNGTSQDLEQQLNDEQSKNEQLEKENEYLEQQNEQLKNDINKNNQDYTLPPDDYTINIPTDDAGSYTFNYDDDFYYAGYWDQQDWTSIWGEYACYDLFETDLASMQDTYDADTPPGSDNWPFINIYGNCLTCEAYIIDYFSTEHFQSIELYKVAGRNYGLSALASLLVSMILYTRQRRRPSRESEMGLMPTDESVGAFT